MTAGRYTRWGAMIALAIGVCLSSGCRLLNKEGSGGKLTSGTRDPLFRERNIPPTSLPTGRSADGKRDPLLTSDNKSASDLPSRKEPFRTGPETTSAGLAAGSRERDDPLLRVAGDEARDRRAGGAATSRGPVMLQGGEPRSVPSVDSTFAELKRLKVRLGEMRQDANDYVLRGEIDIEGVTKRFEGAGYSPAVAAAELLDQVRSARSP